MNDNSIFDEVLELLMKNKQFPYYAAERRLDIFINFFLEDMLTAYYENREVKFVAPEFPLKHEQNNQADKLDYLCVFKKTSQPIFVELKTDSISFKESQCEYYLKKANNWKACMEDLIDVTKNRNTSSSYRLKYYSLVMRLHESGLVSLSQNAVRLSTQIDTLIDCDSQSDKGKRSRLIRTLCSENMSVDARKEARVIYLAPPLKYDDQKYLKNKDVDLIDLSQLSVFSGNVKPEYRPEFEHFAEILQNHFRLPQKD